MQNAEQLHLMGQGLEAFNRGEFYEAHEFWEEVWNVIDDPERTWVQGLIQIATGLHKLTRGRSDVCERLLGRGLDKLEDAQPEVGGIDALDAKAQARAIREAILRGGRPDALGVKLARLAKP